MDKLTIILGNKNYSSWSLRAWAALKMTGAAFEEVVVPLYREDSKARLLTVSASGKVPVLQVGDLAVWDSLAIGETLAELFPEAKLWPEDPAARAVARSVTAEMHSGFIALRSHCPMDVTRQHPTPERDQALEQDIARIEEIWRDCRTRFGAGGDFLFGPISLADAAFLPVASRLASYDITMAGVAGDYTAALLDWPAYGEWCAAAAKETWVIPPPTI